MVGFRSDNFLVEMLDTHRIISILKGRVFGKGMGRNIAHGFKNSGCVRQMSPEKVAERLTFCAQPNASPMNIAKDSNLKIPKLLYHFSTLDGGESMRRTVITVKVLGPAVSKMQSILVL